MGISETFAYTYKKKCMYVNVHICTLSTQSSNTKKSFEKIGFASLNSYEHSGTFFYWVLPNNCVLAMQILLRNEALTAAFCWIFVAHWLFDEKSLGCTMDPDMKCLGLEKGIYVGF